MAAKTRIGEESRVSIFQDKLIEWIQRTVGNKATDPISRSLDIINYVETDKPDFPTRGANLPAFKLRWQGLAQPGNYMAWRADKGRLEITYYHERTDNIRVAERYLEAVREIVTKLLYTKKQFFGIQTESTLLGIPSRDARNPHVVQMQDQYELRIL